MPLMWPMPCFPAVDIDNALVIGAEKMSSIMDWQDRTTCVLFGDGAGAAVLSKEGEGMELLGFLLWGRWFEPFLAMPASRWFGPAGDPRNAD